MKDCLSTTFSCRGLDESADEDDADASNHNKLDEPEAEEAIENESVAEEVVDNDTTLQQVGVVNA